jgi:predicted SAM-dependent methyltransferase
MRWLARKLGMRPIGSYSRVQGLWSRVLRNKRWQYGSVAREKRYLNVGPGGNIYAEYVNVDWAWRPGVDVCFDICDGIHFEDGRFRGIYTEHCLEHVSYAQFIDVLREFLRLLEPGGRVRIIVPDGGLYLDLYQEWKDGKRPTFPYVDTVGQRDLEEDSRYGFTPMMAVNRIFRGYGHQFAWDFETMANALVHVGFIDVERSEFRRGGDPVMLIDSELRRPQSLFVEARKPQGR